MILIAGLLISCKNDDGGDSGITRSVNCCSAPKVLKNNLSQEDNPIEVFNVVTPNGDGNNDVLVVAGIEQYDNNSLRITKNGKDVFFAENYGSSENFFFGKDNKDNNLSAGTYDYTLIINSKETFLQTGSFCLVRVKTNSNYNDCNIFDRFDSLLD